jgi:hypothetical protein
MFLEIKESELYKKATPKLRGMILNLLGVDFLPIGEIFKVTYNSSFYKRVSFEEYRKHIITDYREDRIYMFCINENRYCYLYKNQINDIILLEGK